MNSKILSHSPQNIKQRKIEELYREYKTLMKTEISTGEKKPKKDPFNLKDSTIKSSPFSKSFNSQTNVINAIPLKEEIKSKKSKTQNTQPKPSNIGKKKETLLEKLNREGKIKANEKEKKNILEKNSFQECRLNKEVIEISEIPAKLEQAELNQNIEIIKTNNSQNRALFNSSKDKVQNNEKNLSLYEIKLQLKNRKTMNDNGYVAPKPKIKSKSKEAIKSKPKTKMNSLTVVGTPEKPEITKRLESPSKVAKRCISIDYSQGVSKLFFDMKKKIANKSRTMSLDSKPINIPKRNLSLESNEKSILSNAKVGKKLNQTLNSPTKKAEIDKELKKAFFIEKRKELTEKYTKKIQSPATPIKKNEIRNKNTPQFSPSLKKKASPKTYKSNRPKKPSITESENSNEKYQETASNLERVCQKISFKGYFVLLI